MIKLIDFMSCATCISSSFEKIEIGYRITNIGCYDCKKYDKWVYDGLSMKKRFKQETRHEG